jgi:hypothetical protein
MFHGERFGLAAPFGRFGQRAHCFVRQHFRLHIVSH